MTELQKARELMGLTQSQLDRAAGLPLGSVHEIESGRVKSPSWTNVSRIVRALRESGLKGASAEVLFPIAERKASA
jgi:predicted transcriptional regulator